MDTKFEAYSMQLIAYDLESYPSIYILKREKEGRGGLERRERKGGERERGE
jgi:hypothetical protein